MIMIMKYGRCNVSFYQINNWLNMEMNAFEMRLVSVWFCWIIKMWLYSFHLNILVCIFIIIMQTTNSYLTQTYRYHPVFVNFTEFTSWLPLGVGWIFHKKNLRFYLKIPLQMNVLFAYNMYHNACIAIDLQIQKKNKIFLFRSTILCAAKGLAEESLSIRMNKAN